jgi:hypothetical protein
MRKPTLIEIICATQETAPCFFLDDTMKHWGQTHKDFKVVKSPKGNIYIYAPIKVDGELTVYFTFRQFVDNCLKPVSAGKRGEIAILDYIENN